MGGLGAFCAAPSSASGSMSSVSFEEAPVHVRSLTMDQIGGARVLQGPFTVKGKSSQVRTALGIMAPASIVDSQVKYGRLSAGEGDLILRFPREGYQEYIWDH